MILLLLTAGAVLNAVLCAFAGGVVIVGLIFFLIGLPASKSGHQRNTSALVKFVATVFSTLLILLIYMAITGWNARTGGTLAFSPPASNDAYKAQAEKLVWAGVLQGIYSILAFQWLLPWLIGELKLDRKHKWGVALGALLTTAGGGAAWLI